MGEPEPRLQPDHHGGGILRRGLPEAPGVPEGGWEAGGLFCLRGRGAGTGNSQIYRTKIIVFSNFKLSSEDDPVILNLESCVVSVDGGGGRQLLLHTGGRAAKDGSRAERRDFGAVSVEHSVWFRAERVEEDAGSSYPQLTAGRRQHGCACLRGRKGDDRPDVLLIAGGIKYGYKKTTFNNSPSPTISYFAEQGSHKVGGIHTAADFSTECKKEAKCLPVSRFIDIFCVQYPRSQRRLRS